MESEIKLKPRKKPRQKRSKETVSAILEATAHILQEEGYDKTSTNRVAKRAGVSIGSLYQYFPNKEALFTALFEQHHVEMLALLQETMVEMRDAPLPEAVRAYVHAMIEAHTHNPKLHRALMEQVMHLGIDYIQKLNATVCLMVEAYLESRPEPILPKNLKMASFVLVSAVESVAHTGLLYSDESFAMEELLDELCDLILRYLLGEQYECPPGSHKELVEGKAS
ncbi:MAG: TetR/AcrR family transcriptional regulator [Deltaproteobacteria bacterium]|nr:MAG: TetR/AcrR family transcriptional regulator [Deltaproteobacteria bacterium]